MQLRVLSTLLNEMDGIAPLSQVVVIGATNREDMLDPALLRPGRFDDVIGVEPPDAEGRAQILAIHTKRMPLGGSLDLHGVALECEGWSGAQLSALCREAGMQALRESMLRGGGVGGGGGEPSVESRHFQAALGRVHD